ncbi:hypothetical protein [Streptomyces alkaliphilus]|uniref:Uncharacterized protein n=1 Tax=Streptomyces alkaliphilus TaxID=1472722 RepID=A0A646I8V3_9ACTN|nr:hypothetical protein [Streptomyces alkaliphilus]MQS06064.1 hypothetical protein [Streptomyces alkaliphilus]
MSCHQALFQPGRPSGADRTDRGIPLPELSSRSSAGQRPALRPRTAQRVKVPMRLVTSPHYRDAALSVYIKIKALGRRPEACTAGIATLASYLYLSKSTVERAVAELRAEAADGIVELPHSSRRSLPGGYGTTARRRVRPMSAQELFVWVPVAASESLPPRLLRAYAVIAFAVAQKLPLTEGELAGHLRHHSGRRAGLPLSPAAAGEIIDRLAATGWITVVRRAGNRGRHHYLVHDGPVSLLTSPSSRPVSPIPDDASGHPGDEASLAYKEDTRIDRPDDDGALLSPAEGEKRVVGFPARSVEPPPHPDRGCVPAFRGGGTVRPAPPHTVHPPYTGPRLTFSSRVHAVLEPVRLLLDRVNTYLLRRLGREIGRQLDEEAEVGRLRHRLTARFAVTSREDIRDPGRWLLGVALPRWGCANPDCESGTLWSTRQPCRACAEAALERGRAGRPASPPDGCASPGPGPTARELPPEAVRKLGKPATDHDRSEQRHPRRRDDHREQYRAAAPRPTQPAPAPPAAKAEPSRPPTDDAVAVLRTAPAAAVRTAGERRTREAFPTAAKL